MSLLKAMKAMAINAGRVVRERAGQALLGGQPRAAATILQEMPQGMSPEIPPDRALAWVPAGHFYSPILSAADRTRATRPRETTRNIPGIDVREQAQLALLAEMLPLYETLPFTDAPDPTNRYHYDNVFYSYSDGIHYSLMLLHHKPRRIIEVGSGHSSVLALDIAEKASDPWPMDIKFIEPYPDELRDLARPGDLEERLIQSPLQDVDPSMFAQLEENDFLFIDSTHVAKASSDVNYVIFELLPKLASGVYVHLHDIFYPFEYPDEWINEGRSWNEAYLLRAFLQFNPDFQIVMFNTFMETFHEDWYRDNMPLCLKNRGGSIWLRRT